MAFLLSTERKKRKSKWDQTTPEGVAKTPGSSHDASVSAAAAAARLNAKLEAEGKLQRPMVNLTNTWGWNFACSVTPGYQGSKGLIN